MKTEKQIKIITLQSLKGLKKEQQYQTKSEKNTENDKKVYMAFLDLEQAFDSIQKKK